MADTPPPPVPPMSSQTIDWINTVSKSTLEINDIKLEIYALNEKTPLYRGDIDDFDTFNKNKPFDRPITWFSNYSTAILYGPVVEYHLKRDSLFLAMDNPNNIRWLRSRLNPKEQVDLDDVFEIKSKTKEGITEEYVFRKSEPIEDLIVANGLCNLTKNVGKKSFDGWIHLSMRSHNPSGYMGPEVMICNPVNLITPNSVYPFDDKHKLSQLREERKKRQYEIDSKRRRITYLSNPQLPGAPGTSKRKKDDGDGKDDDDNKDSSNKRRSLGNIARKFEF